MPPLLLHVWHLRKAQGVAWRGEQLHGMMAWTEHGNWRCCCWWWWLMSTKHRPPVTPAISRRQPTLPSKATHVCQFLPAQSVVQAVSSSRRRFGSRSSTAWKRQQRQHNSWLLATAAALPAVLPVLELWVNTASLPCIQICIDCTSAVQHCSTNNYPEHKCHFPYLHQHVNSR